MITYETAAAYIEQASQYMAAHSEAAAGCLFLVAGIAFFLALHAPEKKIVENKTYDYSPEKIEEAVRNIVFSKPVISKKKPTAIKAAKAKPVKKTKAKRKAAKRAAR